MKLFENSVGRPSNEIKKKRRDFIGNIISVIVMVLAIGYFAIFEVDVLDLKGAAATSSESAEQKAIEEAKKEKGTLYPTILEAAKASGFEDEEVYKEIVGAYKGSGYPTDEEFRTSLTKKQLETIEYLNLDMLGEFRKISFKGIEQLKKLNGLVILNVEFDYADFAFASKLDSVQITDCILNNVNFESLKNIESLIIENTNLTSLDLKNSKKLKFLRLINNNNLTDLKLNKNTKLMYIDLYNNGLKNLDLSKNTNLTRLGLYGTGLEKLNLKNNKKIYNIAIDNYNYKFIPSSLFSKIKSVTILEGNINLSKFKNISSLTVGDIYYKASINDFNELKLTSGQNKKITFLNLNQANVTQMRLQSYINNFINLTHFYYDNEHEYGRLDLSNLGSLKDISLNTQSVTVGDNVKLERVVPETIKIYRNSLEIKCSNKSSSKKLTCTTNLPNIKVSVSNNKIKKQVKDKKITLNYKGVKKGTYTLKVSKTGYKSINYKFKVK